MKESKKIQKIYDKVRSQLIAEIRLLGKMHKDIEMDVEFKKPIAFAPGVDEQDEHQLIEGINESEAIVFHQGDEVERVVLEHLSTEILIKVLEGMEESLESAKKFIDK